uniref:Uncharacterized protein n=1 Tax=Pinguiococcus pyrenoidosus TaxID=172671 RepID=A0A7R9U2D1_9STRA
MAGTATEAVMSRLARLEDQLLGFVTEMSGLAAETGEWCRVHRERISPDSAKVLDNLGKRLQAQQVRLERFQNVEVDAIDVTGLSHNQEEARGRRKRINVAIDTLWQEVDSLRSKVTAVLSSSSKDSDSQGPPDSSQSTAGADGGGGSDPGPEGDGPSDRSAAEGGAEALLQRARRIPCRGPDDRETFGYVLQTERSRISNFPPEEILEHASGVTPYWHRRCEDLISNWLAVKRQYGTSVEKRFYSSMTLAQLRSRLIRNRPLVFMGAGDSWMLQSGEFGYGGWEAVGTEAEEEPLVLSRYLSYSEMQLSALLGVSTPTHFINDGGRHNEGVPGMPGTFEEKGNYYAGVGARFEKGPGFNEYPFCVVGRNQNVVKYGYGRMERQGDAAEGGAWSTATRRTPSKEAAARAYMDCWASFYGVSHFPLFDEALADYKAGGTRYVPLSGEQRNHPTAFFDRLVYGRRIEAVAVPFLMDANRRAARKGTMAFCHVVGLGLGVWQISDYQECMMIEVYATLLRSLHLPNVSDVNFAWFDGQGSGVLEDGMVVRCAPSSHGQGSGVRVWFNRREPAARLVGPHENKLVCAMYAWDGASYPGNEYWQGSLSGSGDPAAACCSTIAELQNPDVNVERLNGDAVEFAGSSEWQYSLAPGGPD